MENVFISDELMPEILEVLKKADIKLYEQLKQELEEFEKGEKDGK